MINKEEAIKNMSCVIQDVKFPIGPDTDVKKFLKESEATLLAKELIDYGYRMERRSSWQYDEYSDDLICFQCFKPAIKVTGDNGETTYPPFCPYCGALMED